MPTILVRTRARAAEYSITFGNSFLSQTGAIARDTLGKYAARTVLISSQTVFSYYGNEVVRSLEAGGFQVCCWLMGEGERFKSMRTYERALNFLTESGIGRSDGVIALGGGVVGDVGGFVAATYMRGVPYIQIPTTLLAQVDSSVGGKTGVNLTAGKNLIGSFYQPRAVIIDINTLATLPARELSAGWFETIKQGAVGSRKLFNQTTDFLKSLDSNRVLISTALADLIASHISFKASIISSDEREEVTRRDHRSRKILNFGHTVAHALEAITNYRRYRHGEAVGHGMMVAGTLSKNLGLLEKSELESLKEGIALCGTLPSTKTLDANAIIRAVARDKKASSGNVQWVLLERIGRARIVDGKQISRSLLEESLREGLKLNA